MNHYYMVHTGNRTVSENHNQFDFHGYTKAETQFDQQIKIIILQKLQARTG